MPDWHQSHRLLLLGVRFRVVGWRGWSEIGLGLEQLKREVQEQTQTPTVVVGMDRNFIASEAAFYAVDQGAAVQQTTCLLYTSDAADD